MKNNETLYEAFKAECKIINLRYEYPGYTGMEKYAIITELSEEQIKERYDLVLEQYTPFILLNKAVGEAFSDFKRNEEKFSKRMHRDDVYGFLDGDTEIHNDEIAVPDFAEILFQDDTKMELVWQAFSLLTSVQKKRVSEHLFCGKTFAQMALLEGRDKKTIYESYSAALKKMKIFLENTPTKCVPYSE